MHGRSKRRNHSRRGGSYGEVFTHHTSFTGPAGWSGVHRSSLPFGEMHGARAFQIQFHASVSSVALGALAAGSANQLLMGHGAGRLRLDRPGTRRGAKDGSYLMKLVISKFGGDVPVTLASPPPADCALAPRRLLELCASGSERHAHEARANRRAFFGSWRTQAVGRSALHCFFRAPAAVLRARCGESRSPLFYPRARRSM